MAFFQNRRQRLAAEVASLILPQVQQLIASTLDPKKLDLGQALEIALVKSVDASGNAQEKTASMLFQFMDRAADMAFRRSRQPGGRARARSALRKSGRFARSCRLCANPMIADPSVDEILEHSKHGQSGVLQIEQTKDAVVATVDEAALVEHPDGQGQVLECDNCGPDGRKLN